jgi:hypothetical protein
MQPWALLDLFPADLTERLQTLVRLEPGPALTSFETLDPLAAAVEIRALVTRQRGQQSLVEGLESAFHRLVGRCLRAGRL